MDEDISGILTRWNQAHLLRYLEILPARQRQGLVQDIRNIDFERLNGLFETYRASLLPQAGPTSFGEADVLALDDADASRAERKRLFALGEDCLSQGLVAAFLVAGGQGTRLGFDGPKGCFEISPVRRKSLFRLFAENIRALQRRYGRPLHWYIMTSRQNNDQTLDFFDHHDFFGLSREHVHFCVQRQIPSLSTEGKLIVSRNNRIFKNPDGHGGSICAMHDAGAVQTMAQGGVEEIFYFQVDNPLVKIADPLFVGAHVERRAEMSTKVVKKVDPAEKVGIIGRVDGRLGCIEYHELSAAQAGERKPDGSLRFNSANIAVHMLNRGFVERLYDGEGIQLPYHVAVKEIKCREVRGSGLVDRTVRGVKFEMFIFDALGFADTSVTLEVPRQEEFSPVKNKTGPDSPETARKAMIARALAWLRQSGKAVPVPESFVMEVSPLFALDGEEFRERFVPPPKLSSPLYLE